MPGQSGSLKELLCLFKDTVLEALDFSRGKVHDDSKPLNKVQETLAEGFAPVGTKYEFAVTTPRRIVHMSTIALSCPQSWRMVNDGARIVSPDEKNFFLFCGHVASRTACIRAVLSGGNASLVFPELEKNEWLSFDSVVRNLGEVYDLSPTDYAFSLHLTRGEDAPTSSGEAAKWREESPTSHQTKSIRSNAASKRKGVV